MDRDKVEDAVNVANEVIRVAQKKIEEIECCKELLKDMDGADVCLLVANRDRQQNMANLEETMTENQRMEIVKQIRRVIVQNMNTAAEYLERILRPTEPALIPDPVIDSKEEDKDVPKPAEELVVPEGVKKYIPRQSRMTVPEIEQLLRDGYSKEDIRKKYGYRSVATVENFIKKNKIKEQNLTQGNDRARQLNVRDIPQIRALYTNGPMNLTETAAELRTTKKILGEFVEKNHLVKPAR